MALKARTIVGRVVCGLALVLAVVNPTGAIAADPASPTDIFLGIEPDAERGYEILTTELLLRPLMKIEDIERLWHVWEEEERAKAEVADHDALMRMTFERYGWVKRPGDDVPRLPLGYVEDGQGSIGTNCFSCHGGKVAGRTIPGAGNTHVDLTTLLTDLTRLQALDGGEDPAQVEEFVLPFDTPVNYHKGFTNAVIFEALAWARGNLSVAVRMMKNPEMLLHHDINPPPWWNFKKKTRIYCDAFAPKTPRQIMPFARGTSEEAFHALEPKFVHIYQYIEELEAPRYPFEIDADLAMRGQQFFEQTCAECHGTYGPDGEYPNLVVPIEEVGTDSRRLLAILKEQRQAYNEGWLQYFGEHPLELESEGYLAPPLDGIWASAPYFHNGAAPTLWAVLNSAGRPKVWKRTEDGYDTQRVGLEVDEFSEVPQDLSARQRRMYYDTSHVGNSAAGHTFPDVLDADQKKAVIEYLKTL